MKQSGSRMVTMKTKDNKVGVQLGEVDYCLPEVHVNMSNLIIVII